MASRKAKEFAKLSIKELEERLRELRAELFNLRFQKYTGSLNNYRRLREVRRDIARVLTILTQKRRELEELKQADENPPEQE